MKFLGYRAFTIAFLGALAVSPVTALFWQIRWGWTYLNWATYPFVFFFLAGALLTTRKFSRVLWVGLLASLMYAFIFSWAGGDWESFVRVMVALMPLFLVTEIRDSISPRLFAIFWRVYLGALCIPLVVCILQLLGYVPYYDPGVAYDLYPGRITGGYLKPNNLNAILFPAYLFGFYLCYTGDRRRGIALCALILLVVLISGLRTSVIIYVVILILALSPRITNSLIDFGFRYYVFIVIGITCFFLLGLGRESLGLQAGLRLRLPMWMIHSEYFFDSDFWHLLLGKGRVELPVEAKKFGIASLTEAHNNGIRMIVTFGFVGYCLYGLLLRKVALQISSSPGSDRLRFLHIACLIHVLLYSVTNEPGFYPGVFWPLTAWIFFTIEPTNNSFKE